MTRLGKRHKFQANNRGLRRALPCLVPVNMSQILRKGLPTRRICPGPRWSGGAGTIHSTRVPAVTIGVGGITLSRGCCTTWAMWGLAGPGTFISCTPNITVLSARNVLRRTCLTMRCPRPITRIGWYPWPCAWSLKTAYPTKPPVGIYGAITAYLCPLPPSKTGWKVGGKKAARQMGGAYLDWALADFSGYIAADEVYDGPFCVLSLVDNHTFKRLLYQVLDHDPEHQDIEAFLRRLDQALRQHGLVLRGVTTDGSPLYPEPLQAVFGEVPHQICTFHILKELTKALLQAVAQERKTLAARKPKGKRGRPSTAMAKHVVRQRQRVQQKIADLFEQRYLFVQHDLTRAQRRTLQQITRGLPHLRALRTIMEEVYRLFDRRCRTDTALAKLATLRRRVRRFKHVGKLLSKLHSPNLDKALTFLDDKLLPSTSNAVERGNRRHRKMQKTVYRVRTQENITNRIALDMLRDSQKEGRTNTLASLHYARTR
jgi:hypothetical protein